MTLLVVGGNERMKRDYINLGKEKGYKTKVILNMSARALKDIGSPNAVVMFTSTVSHKLKSVVEIQAKKKSIPVIRHYNSSKVSFMECLDKVDECNDFLENEDADEMHSSKQPNIETVIQNVVNN